MNAARRGSALLLALAFVVVAAILLNVAAAAAFRFGRVVDTRRWREEAIVEARGGVRWAAARLARGEAGPIVRSDGDGTLRVEVEGDRIRATYRLGTVTRTARARWSAGALNDWTEE